MDQSHQAGQTEKKEFIKSYIKLTEFYRGLDTGEKVIKTNPEFVN